jgi:type IV pilus assembly protein PilE
MGSADASTASKGTADSHASLPRELDHAPPQGRAAYRLSLHETDDDDYVLKASPLADGPMRDDIECGTFLLYQNGRRAIRTGTEQDGEAVEHCWG